MNLVNVIQSTKHLLTNRSLRTFSDICVIAPHGVSGGALHDEKEKND